MKKYFIVLLTLLVSISLTACHSEDQSDAFLEFINQYMIEELSHDYTSMHTYFEKPEDYGIDLSKVEISLGERVSDETIADSQKELEELEKELNKFNRNSLNDDVRKIYDEFKLNLKQNIELSKDKYKYLGTVFEADTGLHIDMTTLFTEWVLRDEQDVKDLIILVNDVKPYIDSFLEFTNEQAKQGYLMIDIESVTEYCDAIVKSGKNNSTLTTMKDNIDSLNLSNGDLYKQQLEDAFMNSFIPAYENISLTLKSLKAYENNTEGLASLENGKDYYAHLMQSKIGSNKSVSEVKNMLEEASDRYLTNMQFVYLKDTAILDEVDNLKTEYSSYKEIMEYLKECYKKDFPEVSNLNYDINEINPEVASKGIAAYFVVPALDSTKNKQIKVNTHDNTRDIQDIDTFTTTAHEGIPGHMYMYAYVYENCDQLYYKLNSNLSFTEGYATYVELYSMKYLKNVNQNALDLLKYNQMYSSCIIALADIGIHYEGWSFEEFSDFLENKGMSVDEEVYQKQYNQLQSNPAAFIPYYVGLVEIDNLKLEAQEKIGEQFVDKEFHKALIQDGSRTFNVIEENIEEYINEHK